MSTDLVKLAVIGYRKDLSPCLENNLIPFNQFQFKQQVFWGKMLCTQHFSRMGVGLGVPKEMDGTETAGETGHIQDAVKEQASVVITATVVCALTACAVLDVNDLSLLLSARVLIIPIL